MLKKNIVRIIASVMVWIMCFANISYAAGNGWVKDSEGWKHFTKEQADTGWYSEGRDIWYCLGGDGNLLTGWYYDEATDGRYYLNRAEDGVEGLMRFGWYRDSGLDWYFLNTEHNGSFGKALSGWNWIDGFCYFFDKNGRMLSSQITPDGYTVDKDGRWTENGIARYIQKKGYSSKVEGADTKTAYSGILSRKSSSGHTSSGSGGYKSSRTKSNAADKGTDKDTDTEEITKPEENIPGDIEESVPSEPEIATPSDTGDEISSEPEKATPSDTGDVIPSKPEKATPSDIEKKDGYCTVKFDFNYEGAPEPVIQEVKTGEKAKYPELPSREGYIAIAWYENAAEEDYRKFYPVEYRSVQEDLTLYVHWADIETDTDADEIADDIEKIIGTDPMSEDSDGDGLTDYEELYVLYEYNPLMEDSDENGVTDSEEDADGDGLGNLYELSGETNPVLYDTDGDGLNDYDETEVYKTNALLKDTDSDGASDGREVKAGTDPLTAESSFHIVEYTEGKSGYKAGVDVVLKGEQVDTLKIEEVEDELLFPETMPGYIDSAFEFTVDGEIDTAVISFEFDEQLLSTPEFDPVIYYFNEEEQWLEELETRIEGNVASATTTHFSKYILADRRKYNKNLETFHAYEYKYNEYDAIELVLVLDETGNMDENDSISRRFGILKRLVENMPERAKIGIVKVNQNTEVTSGGLTADRDKIKQIIEGGYEEGSGYNNLFEVENDAFAMFGSRDNVLRMAVILTDVQENDYMLAVNAVQKALEKQAELNMIGFGKNKNVRYQFVLEEMSKRTGGKYYYSADINELNSTVLNIEYRINVTTDSDKDGLPDYYEENGIRLYNNRLVKSDKNNKDSDGDTLEDGSEISFARKTLADGREIVYGIMTSDPMLKDTDNDTYNDAEDTRPLISDTEVVTLTDADKFIDIYDGSQRYYGGDQDWYAEALSTMSESEAGKFLDRDWYTDMLNTMSLSEIGEFARMGGCGTVAAADIMAYMHNHAEGCEALYAYDNYEKSNYIKHMLQTINYVNLVSVPVFVPKDISVPGEWGTSGIIFEKEWYFPFGVPNGGYMQKKVKEFANSRGVSLKVAPKPGIFTRKTLYEYIKSGLEKDCPVAILSLNNQSMRGYTYWSDGTQKSYDEVNFYPHWMLITGMRSDQNKGTVELKVSTWGGYAVIDLDMFILSELWWNDILYFEAGE